MSLTPGLNSAIDLFHKLQREVGRLDHETTHDNFFNIVVTGYSLIDWVKSDPSLPSVARSAPEISRLHAEPWLKVCGDLANASKHFVLSKRKPVTTNVTSGSGYGIGRFGKGSFGEGEHDIQVHIDGGYVWTALEFATGVLQAWIQFFERHEVLI